MRTGLVGVTHQVDSFRFSDPRGRSYLDQQIQRELMHLVWDKITEGKTIDQLADELPVPVSVHILDVDNRPAISPSFAAYAPAEVTVRVLVVSEDLWATEIDGVASDAALLQCGPDPRMVEAGTVYLERIKPPVIPVGELDEASPVGNVRHECRVFRRYFVRKGRQGGLVTWKRLS